MSDQERLAGLVEVWWQAIDDFTSLLEGLPGEAWSLPTDLAGWDVHAVAAHIAHLESVLAGDPHEDVGIGEPEHVRSPLGQFTEQGVVARRDRSPDELINEIRSAATRRKTALLADPPSDPDAPAPGVFGALGWSTLTLLRNRPLDVWMHEQDVRRAVDEPGGLDSPAAAHTADYLSESLGYVLAKRLGEPAGTSAVLEVAGHQPRAAVVNEQGRGTAPDEPPTEPTVRIRMDREAFVVLAGGRRTPPQGRVEVTGDEALGRRILAAMAVTP